MLFKLSSHEGKPPGVSVMWCLTINLAAVLSHIIGFLKRFSFKHAKNNIHYKYEGNLLHTLRHFIICSTSYGKFTINGFKSCCYKALYSHVKILHLLLILCKDEVKPLCARPDLEEVLPFVCGERKGTSGLFNKTALACFLQGNHFC